MSYRNWRRRSRQPVKLDLDLKIKNFGPVSQGEIQLKPLTIFIGPNNSGKSYIAMLVHSILSSERRVFTSDMPFRFMRAFYDKSGSFQKEIRKYITVNMKENPIIIPTIITKKIIDMIYEEFNEDLKSSIERNFGSAISELVKTKQRQAKISILNHNKFDIAIDKTLIVRNKTKFDIKPKFKIISDKHHGYSLYEESEKDPIITPTNHEDRFGHNITLPIIDFVFKKIAQHSILPNSYYFPAARSGILQGHRALSASIIKNAPFGGIESLQIPELTGVVSDFISDIILIQHHNGPFFELASQLEFELFNGHIQSSIRTKNTFPEITFVSEQNKIPLHRTSSTISEITPLSLYLKHIIDKNCLLIIEEPEAHLHPANQLIFAKYIVKMIRSGLNILITTHSVFLLEALGKFMIASKIPTKTRTKKLKSYIDDYLLPEEVSPYVFVKNNNGGHNILPIEKNDEVGIAQDEFIKVNDLLYSESINLQDNLPENK